MKRNELVERLDKLEAQLPLLIREYADPDDLHMAIAGEADVIEDGAAEADDARYVTKRVAAIMVKAGLSA